MAVLSFSINRTRAVAALLLAASLSGIAQAPAPAKTQPSTASTASTATAHPPASASPAAEEKPLPAVLLARIAKLPPLGKTGINAAQQSTAILAHLNDILRLYRAATVPVQKTGEPSDVLYAEQDQTEVTQIAQLAFQSAANEAALLVKADPAGMAAANSTTPQPKATTQAETQRLAALRASTQAQITTLQAQSDALTTQLAHATDAERALIEQQQQQIGGELELQQATAQALDRVGSLSDVQVQTGLSGDIQRLSSAVPAIQSGAAAKPIAPPPMESLSNIHQAGVSSQAEALFQLLVAHRDIENMIAVTDHLHTEATDLRTPFLNMLRNTLQQGQQLAQQPAAQPATGAPGRPAAAPTSTRAQYDQLTATFNVLSDSMLPLTQEIVLLETERSTLTAWETTVHTEYTSILRSLLLRIGFIALALFILFIASVLWSRATVKYVQDLRRRRQLLLVRRIVIGFLSFLVLLFGFVTQFSSLATFAGFITAGIAVGLQSILLSIAAYFFIIGRYGVKVGDRITVAGVTGDVVEVGLVRFYMMELVGSGTALHTTGRVAVFANSVLFQTGTPLYKQMPGTEYGWHELIAKLNAGADVEAVRKSLLDAVSGVYETYRADIEAQHAQVENWAGTAIEMPAVNSRLEMTDAGLQIVVLFPVEIQHAAEADQKIASALLDATAKDGPLKSGLNGIPTISSSIKP
jgi:small-conductance mechanosensitive channel